MLSDTGRAPHRTTAQIIVQRRHSATMPRRRHPPITCSTPPRRPRCASRRAASGRREDAGGAHRGRRRRGPVAPRRPADDPTAVAVASGGAERRRGGSLVFRKSPALAAMLPTVAQEEYPQNDDVVLAPGGGGRRVYQEGVHDEGTRRDRAERLPAGVHGREADVVGFTRGRAVRRARRADGRFEGSEGRAADHRAGDPRGRRPVSGEAPRGPGGEGRSVLVRRQGRRRHRLGRGGRRLGRVSYRGRRDQAEPRARGPSPRGRSRTTARASTISSGSGSATRRTRRWKSTSWSPINAAVRFPHRSDERRLAVDGVAVDAAGGRVGRDARDRGRRRRRRDALRIFLTGDIVDTPAEIDELRALSFAAWRALRPPRGVASANDVMWAFGTRRDRVGGLQRARLLLAQCALEEEASAFTSVCTVRSQTEPRTTPSQQFCLQIQGTALRRGTFLAQTAGPVMTSACPSGRAAAAERPALKRCHRCIVPTMACNRPCGAVSESKDCQCRFSSSLASRIKPVDCGAPLITARLA